MTLVLPPGVIRPQASLMHRAMLFAIHAHNNAPDPAHRVRKNAAQDPYFVHPIEVATLVAMSGGSEEEIAAAYLHDTVEDTDTTIEQITELFGTEVALIVDGLTDPPEFKSLPTPVRKSRQAVRLLTKSASVKRVKVADANSNVGSLISDPPVTWTHQKCVESLAGAVLMVVIDRLDHPTFVRLMEREEPRIPRVIAISDYPRLSAHDLLERIHEIVDLVPLRPRPLKHHLQFLEKDRVHAQKNARRSAQVLRQQRRHFRQHRG